MRRVLLLSLIGLAMMLSINYAIDNLDADRYENIAYNIAVTDRALPDDIKVTVYPNPLTDEQLTIKSDNGIVEIEILDIVGKTIFKAIYKNSVSITTVSFKEFSKGYYIVKVTLEGKKFHTEKILFK
ncbi:MAG: T9SS type A sorting domain-containing protein [Bacteroidales bacterium]|nr:T9SS type A sorting domain-containing protein [Bacteroidales bacterium]